MNRHEGRVALVTGARQGIGRATALRLAADGATVVVNDLEQSPVLQGVADEIVERGGRAIVAAADVSDQGQVGAMVDRVVDQLGRLDILVNNAGIFPWRAWTEISVDEWDRVLGVNARGCFICARAVYPHMQAQGWGRIISMSSSTYLAGSKNLLHYAASKGAVVGFTRALAMEVGDDGITVNAVSTGLTHTEGVQEWFDSGVMDYEERVASRQLQSIKRLGTPEEVAATISFLASDDAGYITGQLFNVDGGRNKH